MPINLEGKDVFWHQKEDSACSYAFFVDAAKSVGVGGVQTEVTRKRHMIDTPVQQPAKFRYKHLQHLLALGFRNNHSH
jgi:hypothetical protein